MNLADIVRKSAITGSILTLGILGNGCGNSDDWKDNVGIALKAGPTELRAAADRIAQENLPGSRLCQVMTGGQFALMKNERDQFYFKVPDWAMIYSNGKTNLTVDIQESGESYILNPQNVTFKDPLTQPITNWLVSVDEAMFIANQAGAKGGHGYFQLEMQNVNGVEDPVWILPQTFDGHNLAKIDARTGEPLKECNASTPKNKTLGNGILSDGKLEFVAGDMTIEHSFNPIDTLKGGRSVDDSYVIPYRIRNISGHPLSIRTMETRVQNNDNKLRIYSCSTSLTNWMDYYINEGEKFTVPGSKVDEQGRSYFEGYPIYQLDAREIWKKDVSTGGREAFDGIDKIQIIVNYEGGEKSIFTDYLTGVKEKFKKNPKSTF